MKKYIFYTLRPLLREPESLAFFEDYMREPSLSVNIEINTKGLPFTIW